MFTQTLRADGIYIRPTSGELEPKCVPQWYLGWYLGTRWSAVGQNEKVICTMTSFDYYD